MRMMLNVAFPTGKFNELWKSGQLGPKMKQIIEDTKPEAIYFGKNTNGLRGAVVIVDVPSPADLPRITEPWYLTFEAEMETSICMTPEDIENIDVDALTKKYT